MKKAFDQTVRDLKREVNKKVLKVPGVEQKVLDATSNEPWGPHGSHLADIAQATRNFHEYQMIMSLLWKRVNDTGKNWRHVYKALIVLEYLVAHGSERVIDEICEHAYQISTLSNFQYIDSSGRDQGSNVRKKSQSLVALVNDKEKVQEVRQKAHGNREKFHTPASGMHKSSAYSSTGGGYGDRHDDDRYEGCYGSRDDDQNGYGRDRDEDHYGRCGGPYSRDGDLCVRDSDERYNREGNRDDDYRGHSSDDYQTGYQRRSSNGERNRSGDKDDHYSSRSGTGRVDDYPQDERWRLERKLSSHHSASPSYKEAVADAENHPRDERDEGSVGGSVHKASRQMESTSQNQSPTVTSVFTAPASKEGSDFDEFDPRGSFSAAPTSIDNAEKDFLGALLAPSSPMASVTTAHSSADVFADPGYMTPFETLSPAPNALNQPAGDLFGDSPFKAMPSQEPANSQAHSSVPTATFPAALGEGSGAPHPPAAKVENINDFGFGESFQRLTYTPAPVQSQANPEFPLNDQPIQPTLQQYLQLTQQPPQPYLDAATQLQQPPQAYPQPLPYLQQPPQPYMQALSQMPSQASLQPQSQVPPQPQAQQSQPYLQQPQPYLQSQPQSLAQLQPQQMTDVLADLPQFAPRVTPSAQPAGPIDMAAKLQTQKNKFEPKSAVWADTLSRGLVDLNISGPKTNPLSDIGIDFDSIHRKEKRREKEKEKNVAPSTTYMGKAMGAGSGIGRAGATGLAPPPNPMMGAGIGMGMGMGMGNGVGMGMGGYAFGMNQPMGMGMGAGVAAQVQPGAGMLPSGPGMAGYNPMMGLGGFGPQNPYGGYR